MRRRKGDLIAAQEALAGAEGDRAVLSAQLAGLNARIEKLPQDTAAARAQLEGRAAQLAQARAQMEGRKGYELRAPTAGRVSAVQATLGQPADPSKPLMTLTPATARLRAEIYASSRAIGFIAPGQRVRLLYEAFPYQKFGPAWGVADAVRRPCWRQQRLRPQCGWKSRFTASPCGSTHNLSALSAATRRSPPAWLSPPTSCWKNAALRNGSLSLD